MVCEFENVLQLRRLIKAVISKPLKCTLVHDAYGLGCTPVLLTKN